MKRIPDWILEMWPARIDQDDDLEAFLANMVSDLEKELEEAKRSTAIGLAAERRLAQCLIGDPRQEILNYRDHVHALSEDLKVSLLAARIRLRIARLARQAILARYEALRAWLNVNEKVGRSEPLEALLKSLGEDMAEIEQRIREG